MAPNMSPLACASCITTTHATFMPADGKPLEFDCSTSETRCKPCDACAHNNRRCQYDRAYEVVDNFPYLLQLIDWSTDVWKVSREVDGNVEYAPNDRSRVGILTQQRRLLTDLIALRGSSARAVRTPFSFCNLH